MTACSRRTFIKGAVGASVAGATLGLDGFLGLAGATDAARTTIAVVRNGSPEALTRAAVGELGGIARFVTRGDVVVVKPNIGWDRNPEQAANTNPEVVSTVVRLCLEAGAKRVRVMDRSCNDPRRSYRNSGILDAVGAIGDPAATVEFMDERRFVPVEFARGESLKKWNVCQDVLEADRRINIAIAKHHNATRLTMCLKNTMGVLGGNRGNIHRDLDQMIADMNSRITYDLHLLDAVRILTGNGPQGGRLADVRRLDTLIAGTDPVAVDAFGATLFGIGGRDVPHVVRAAQLGLGEIALERVHMKTRDVAAG